MEKTTLPESWKECFSHVNRKGLHPKDPSLFVAWPLSSIGTVLRRDLINYYCCCYYYYHRHCNCDNNNNNNNNNNNSNNNNGHPYCVFWVGNLFPGSLFFHSSRAREEMRALIGELGYLSSIGTVSAWEET